MPRASRPNRRVEMRQEVRPCVSFLAVSLAGRNRPVSTMAVYQPRQRPAIRRVYRTRRALASWRRPIRRALLPSGASLKPCCA